MGFSNYDRAKKHIHPLTGEETTVRQLSEELSAKYNTTVTPNRLVTYIWRYGLEAGYDRLVNNIIGIKNEKRQRRFYVWQGRTYDRHALYEACGARCSESSFFLWLAIGGEEFAIGRAKDFISPGRKVSKKKQKPAPKSSCVEGHGIGGIRVSELVGYVEDEPLKPGKSSAPLHLSLVTRRGLERKQILCAESMRPAVLQVCETCQLGCFQ